MPRTAVILLAALICLLPFAAVAQDTDGDGLPDAMEDRIGSSPQFAEVFDLLVTDKTKEEGDRVGTDNYAPGLDIVGLYLANVAQDRWLWRVDFLDDPIIANLGLIIYIQADDDQTTGRQNMKGIDYMLTCGQGQASLRMFNPDGSERPGTAHAEAIGKSLYVCADLKLNQVDGKTRCYALVLAETRDPYKMVDNIGQFDFVAQGESDRPKPTTIADSKENENFVVTWGLDQQRAARKDPDNVVLPIQDCETHGFQYDHFTEYHMPSARIQEGGPYTVEATIQTAGTYHPAFIVYDDSGRQVYTVSLNGKRLGIAVAKQENRRQAFFALAEPVEVKQGDKLKVELVYREGGPRIEDLFLLAKLPEIRQLAREFRYIEVAPRHGRVTFVSTWPVKATFEWGADQNYGNVIEDEEAESNHRLLSPDLASAPATIFYRLSGETPEGDNVVVTGSARNGAPLVASDNLARTGSIPLRVRNEHDAAVLDWPVTQGVPFPEGALGDPDNVRLLDANGRELPLQRRQLAQWPDGTIKWLLLDFQTNLPAKDEVALSLEYGTGVRAATVHASAVRVSDAQGGYDIDTGSLKLSLNSAEPGAIAGIWLDRNGDGAYTDNERLAGQAGFGSTVALNDAFPSVGLDLAPVKVERLPSGDGGLHESFRVTREINFAEQNVTFLDEYDIHVYAGKPYMRVFHTWTSSGGSSDWADVDEWGLVSDFAVGAGAQATVGGLDGPRPVTDSDVIVSQPFDDSFTVAAEGKVASEGKRAPGWMDVAGPDAGVTVAMRNFWQLYPKSLAVRTMPDGVARLFVGIMPEFVEGKYKISKEGELEDKLYYYLKDDTYHLRQGMSKRHELLYFFRSGGESSDEALATSTVFQRPPVAVAPEQWYCDSKAFTDVLPSSPELGGIYRIYEESTRASLDAYLASRDNGHEYGMLNFGDWWGERGRNWGNIEYDTQHAFYLQFIRSGDLDFFYAGEEACRHNMDVDTVRAHRDPSRVGCIYSHCIGHVGGYYDHMINEQGSPSGGFSITHAWVQGFLDNYFLTGDVRGIETARIFIDHFDKYYLRVYDYNNNRTSGWHLINTLDMYRATLDPYYLNAARIVMERVTEREVPEGGWTRQMTPGHCLCMPRHRGEAAFMTGILLTGLKDYHEITGDQHAADMMVRGSKNIIEETWIPDKNGMRYTSCPNSSQGTGLSTLVTEGILYAYGLSGDPEIGEVALAGTLQAATRVSNFGKGFSQQIRVTPHFLHQLRELRLTETAVELGDEPVTALIKSRPGTPFDIVLRPRDGAQAGRARLIDPAGNIITDIALDPQVQAVSASEGVDPVQGVYRLELSGAGAWGIDSFLSPTVIRVGDTARFAPGPAARTYFVAPGQKVTVKPPTDPANVSDTYVTPLEAARILTGYTIPAQTSAQFGIDGKSKVIAPWSQFWFDPGQPTASAKVGWKTEAGRPRVVLDATGSTDPNGEIKRAYWTIDGKPAGEGLSLNCEVKPGETYEIGLRVVDDSGLENVTATTVRVPPSWVLEADPKRACVIEAEDFSKQEGGTVKVETRYSSGEMITGWHAYLNHTLTWTVDIPASGKYVAALKYATGSENTRRDFKVDGEYLHPGLKEFHLPITGGYSTGVDNWVYVRLGELEGEPFVFEITKGPHEISMSNLGDGCALDQLYLIPVD